jgi:6-phosphogluconolactonase (cycloisomerase 2 family)
MKKIFFLSILTSLLFSCKKGNTDLTLAQRIAENGQNPDELALINRTSKNNVGYVYTESNDAGTNRILIYKQGFDGRLTPQGSVASGGAGTGNLFGSQGALVLDDKHAWLYAVNAGSNSVSSFRVGNEAV